MTQSWNERVRVYLDQLEEVAATINSLLDQTQVDTMNVKPGEIQESIGHLQTTLVTLQEKIALREELLADDDAPSHGLTLTDKLQHSSRPEDSELAQRSESVANLISEANSRAISLFVCQYHLTDFSTEIVRLLAGANLPSTYHPTESDSMGVGGSLFNEAG